MKYLTYFTLFLLVTLLSCGKKEARKEVILAYNDYASHKQVKQNTNRTLSVVKQITGEILGIKVDSIRATSKLADLGIKRDFDDIDYVELVMHIEAEFEMEIPDVDAEQFETIGEICDYIESHTAH
jgi:acyl carrier protein